MDNEGPQISVKKPSAHKDAIYFIALIACLILIAVVMVMFVFRSYEVDGISMESTLMNGNKLIIWKVPRTWAEITGQPYIPKRGDIIVFTESGLAKFGQQNTKQLIKRVIGLPGDTVVVNNGVYDVFNKQHPHGFNPDKTLPYGKQNPLPYTSGDLTVKLGHDQLFVSGDNRPESLDSRDFGPINANQIIGQLIFRVYPINKVELF